MMSLPQLKQATDSLNNMAEIERQQIVEYGVRSVRLFNDSIKLPEINPSIQQTSWFQNLTRVEKNNIFSKAKEISRNQVRGIENALEKVEGRELRRDRHSIEWHRKFILSVSCLVLFFVGASLGALTKRGGMGMPVVLAISIFITYYIISMVGEQMVKSGSLPPSIGMWLSTLILVPLAIALTVFAMREGRIFK
jgi:lipopolysaccharide export system permease protein